MCSLYIVSLSQTDGVSRQFETWPHEDVDVVYQACGRLSKHILEDIVAGVPLADYYTLSDGDVVVAVTALLHSNKLFVTITAASFDGDWDPDGGEGVDHLAFGKMQDVAKACATHIGRQLSFCQLSGWPIPAFEETIIVDIANSALPAFTLKSDHSVFDDWLWQLDSASPENCWDPQTIHKINALSSVLRRAEGYRKINAFDCGKTIPVDFLGTSICVDRSNRQLPVPLYPRAKAWDFANAQFIPPTLPTASQRLPKLTQRMSGLDIFGTSQSGHPAPC